MAQRISRTAVTLKDQMTQAIAAIGALGPGAWPTSAPTAAALTTARDNINTSIIDTDAKADAWKIAAQLKETRVLAGVDLMKKVDDATDLIYGPSAAEKNNFGLPPKGAAIEPLHKLIQIVLKDGILPGSILADCENITGAAFEWQWAATSTFGSPVGSAVSTPSEYMVNGLSPGTQYWIRVRPVRGSETAPWSDPATRVAPL